MSILYCALVRYLGLTPRRSTTSVFGNAMKNQRRDYIRSKMGSAGQYYKPDEGYIRKIMQGDVLYLLVVNMPSEEELAAAREKLQRENRY